MVVHAPLLATLVVDVQPAEGPALELKPYRFRTLPPLRDAAPFETSGAPEDASLPPSIRLLDARGPDTDGAEGHLVGERAR